MHLEFLPGDAPDADVQFGVPSEQITDGDSDSGPPIAPDGW